MSEAGEHRRALRGGAARLQERRAMAVLGREARRRNQRSEVVMARRQLSPPPAPRQPPAAAAVQSDAKRMKLERWKQRKLAQKHMKKDQKLCQPPFRAGVRTPAFSIYDMNAAGRAWGPAAPRRGRSATAASATQAVPARGRRAVAAAPPTVGRAAGGRTRRPAAPTGRRVTRATLRADDMAVAAALAAEDEVLAPAEEDAGGDVGPTSGGPVHSLAPPDFHSFRAPAGLQAFSFPSPRHYANSEGCVTALPIERSEPVAVEIKTCAVEPATVTDEPVTVTDEPATVTDEPVTVTDEPATVTDEPERPTAEEDVAMEQPAPLSAPLSVAYFRGLLRAETVRLCAAADAWDDARAAAGATVELRGDVLSVQGQVRLLVRERFAQFEKLVDQCEHGIGELPTTLNDLHGFWEMIYFQVEDVDQKLARLAELKRSGWKEVSTSAAAAVSSRGKPAAADRGGRKRPLKPAATAGAKQTASAGLRSMMAAARKRLASSVQDPADVAVAATPPPSADDKRFTAGFFEVQSPAVSQDAITASIQRCREADLRRSVHLLSAQKRLEQQSTASFSPLLARVSASAKQLSLSAVSSPALSCRTAAVAGTVLSPLVCVNSADSARTHKRGGSSRRRSSRPLAQLMAGSPFPAASAVRREPSLLAFAGDELGGSVALSSPAGADLMVLATPARRSTRLQTIRTSEHK